VAGRVLVRSIVVEPGCTRRAVEEIGALRAAHDRVVCMFDPAVAEVARSVGALFAAQALLPVGGGEGAKRLARVEALGEELLALGCTRRSLLVAVGGGALTDLCGFVAAVYMRGIAHVNVPTTLLAMCDAALGGKTAVDLPSAKNAVGAFHPAALVLIDPDVLATLPQPELRDGVVEALKMAAILDRDAFEALAGALEPILAREPEALRRCIETAVRLKTAVVDADPREAGRRMLLNFGHTVGHALEALSGYRLSHGAAVAIGMVHELRLAGSPALAEVERALAALGMPVELPAGTDLEALWRAMQRDKKNAAGAVRIAVPDRLGSGRVLEVRREQVCPRA
jgi:3-dehydroquinate synthase